MCSGVSNSSSCTRKHSSQTSALQRIERLHPVELAPRAGRSSRAATCRGRRRRASSGAPQKRHGVGSCAGQPSGAAAWNASICASVTPRMSAPVAQRRVPVDDRVQRRRRGPSAGASRAARGPCEESSLRYVRLVRMRAARRCSQASRLAPAARRGARRSSAPAARPPRGPEVPAVGVARGSSHSALARAPGSR